jgi:hypothetical protein
VIADAASMLRVRCGRLMEGFALADFLVRK